MNYYANSGYNQSGVTPSQEQNRNNDQKNIIFYSRHCQHSKKIMEYLKKAKVDSKFFKICVDIRGIRIPRYVNSVPTLIVHDKSGNKKLLVDRAAFEWVNMLLDTPVELDCYATGELSTTLSDNYAYLDGTEAEKNFGYLDKDNCIITPKDDNKEDSQQFYSKLEVLKAQRDQEVNNKPPPPTSKPDFSMGNVEVDNRSIDNYISQRTQETIRGPVPMRSPNFQSSNFQSDMFQSKRGTGYQTYGNGVRAQHGSQNPNTADFNRMMNERNQNVFSIQKPQQMPDFSCTERVQMPLRQRQI